MTNPHCLPPVPFGTETPDGGLMLHPEEAKWLRAVFARIDTAQSEINEAFFALPERVAAVRKPSTEFAQRMAVRYCEPLVDVEVMARTEEDENNYVTRLRGKLTIIRGGLPPRPAF